VTDDFSQCLVSSTRMAARAITRRYDAYLRPYGVTSTQLSLLGAIRQLPAATVSELAELRGFERTTLTRNLDRLTQMGLVAAAPPRRGNGRLSTLTGKGEALLDRLLPQWRRAQAEMRSELSRETFDDSLRVLHRLAKVSEGTST
jgi:DNA-binding MarR family transcriptional regulator